MPLLNANARFVVILVLLGLWLVAATVGAAFVVADLTSDTTITTDAHRGMRGDNGKQKGDADFFSSKVVVKGPLQSASLGGATADSSAAGSEATSSTPPTTTAAGSTGGAGGAGGGATSKSASSGGAGKSSATAVVTVAGDGRHGHGGGPHGHDGGPRHGGGHGPPRQTTTSDAQRRKQQAEQRKKAKDLKQALATIETMHKQVTSMQDQLASSTVPTNDVTAADAAVVVPGGGGDGSGGGGGDWLITLAAFMLLTGAGLLTLLLGSLSAERAASETEKAKIEAEERKQEKAATTSTQDEDPDKLYHHARAALLAALDARKRADEARAAQRDESVSSERVRDIFLLTVAAAFVVGQQARKVAANLEQREHPPVETVRELESLAVGTEGTGETPKTREGLILETEVVAERAERTANATAEAAGLLAATDEVA
jgi:hypothetical protein